MDNIKLVKRSCKNVIKNLVKENQRVHDYYSKFGVKFWNKILKDSKKYSKNNKVFDENVVRIIKEDYEKYNKWLEEEDDEEKKEILKEKIFQLEFFIDGRWEEMFNENARLKSEFREILYLKRKGVIE